MATVSALSERLRSELGDLGKTFVYQTVADGTSVRYPLPYSPVDGTSMIITVDGTDVSTTVEVEEHTGILVFDDAPEIAASIVVAGSYFRFFTNAEIEQYITTALSQHTANHPDGFGRPVTVDRLPLVEEYPVVVLATSMAMYTLATDASFDIDIIAPDGVNIPRSERFRQLMQMMQERQDQYKTLCSQLGIGMYKVDVFSLRRISKTTNRYVPIYLPMEVDDRSKPRRAVIPMPTYGSQEVPSSVPEQDFYLYQGDSFVATLVFPYDISGYTWKAQIHMQYGDGIPIQTFNITQVNTTTLEVSLTSQQSAMLPNVAVWDIQAKSPTDATYEQTYMRGKVYTTPQATQ